jgi:hypothetical protein
LATALSAKDASNASCFPDGCNDLGLQKRGDAVSRGNLATFLGVGGAVLLAAGATSFYFGRRSNATAREAPLSAQFTLGLAPGGLAAGIAGGF